jgi:predicted nucleic acid-binding protein
VIVVDTNVIAYLYIPSEYTEVAQSLLAANRNWAAPVLWRSEFRNVLGGYVRRGDFDLDKALFIQKRAEQFMADGEFSVESADVLKLVQGSPCTAYDCEFVALAQRLKVPLVTMDKQLLKHFGDTARKLV